MSQPEPAPLPSETLILETPSPTRSNQVQPDPIRPFAPAKTHRRSTDETPESQQARLMMRELSRVQSLTSGSVSSFDHLTNDLSPQYPFECVHSHILDQLSGTAYWTRGHEIDAHQTKLNRTTAAHNWSAEARASSFVSTSASSSRARLHVTVSIMDIKDINATAGTFEIKCRIYAFFEVPSLESLDLGHIAQKIVGKEYYSLDSDEIGEVESKWGAKLQDLLMVLNAIETEKDDFALRVYGGKPAYTGILWNQGWRIVCREKYHLQQFPFDMQKLNMELRMNDPKTWDRFDMLVTGIQFHKSAIEQLEW